MKWVAGNRYRFVILELGMIGLMAAIVFILSGKMDVFETISEFSSAHEHWELDEVISTSIFLTIALSIFAVRRVAAYRKLLKQYLDKNKELTEALHEIKQLEGIIPICASCKAIRDEAGNWHPVECYVRDRSEADFSHSICPECVSRLYPDFAEE